MKKTFCFLICICFLVPFSMVTADSSFIEVADQYISSVANLSDKQSFICGATGTDDRYSTIQFDFTKGNKTIIAIDGDKCKVYGQFDDAELLGIIYSMIAKFDAIENELHNGKQLRYGIRISEDNTIYLDSNSINNFFSL